MILVQYEIESYLVQNVQIVHRSSMTLNSITRRKKLSDQALSHGFQGCTIDLTTIPNYGRIQVVTEGMSTNPRIQKKAWNFANIFLSKDPESRSWIADVASSIEKLPSVFSLAQVYRFKSDLKRLHTSNYHIEEKIRQQLQILRRYNIVEFLGSGVYRHRPKYWK